MCGITFLVRLRVSCESYNRYVPVIIQVRQPHIITCDFPHVDDEKCSSRISSGNKTAWILRHFQLTAYPAYTLYPGGDA